MPTPHDALRRRAVLAAGLAAALPNARAAADTPNALQPWQPKARPSLQATELASDAPRTLADFAGHALVINFWATWCAPCRLELPSLNATVERFEKRGLRLLAVNHGEMPERVKRFLDEVPIRGTVLLDRSQGQLRAWGARGLPASFVIDAKGKPRLSAIGELDWRAPQVVDALEKVLSG